MALQAGIGLLARGVYLCCVFSSVEFGVSAGTSALVTALQSIAAAALAGPGLEERTSSWPGLVVGLAGVVLVVSADMGGQAGAPPWAYLLSFTAMVALVAATLIERKTEPRTSLADATLIQCITSAVLFTILGISTGNATPPADGGFWIAVDRHCGRRDPIEPTGPEAPSRLSRPDAGRGISALRLSCGSPGTEARSYWSA